MFGKVGKGYRGDGGAGFSWPNSPDGTGVVADVFGPRPFSPHIPTVGYDYDFHRGIDIVVEEGDPVYSPASGALIRKHYCHFGFEVASQLEEFTVVNGSASLSRAHVAGAMRLTCGRVGVTSFPTTADHIAAATERIAPDAADWVLEMELGAAISVTGAVGIGVKDAAGTEYVALEYDGTTFTVRGKTAGGLFTADGSTFAVSGRTWLRVNYDVDTDTFSWLHSANGSSWTTLTSESGKSFAASTPYMVPVLYWRSGDTDAVPYTIDVSRFNWVDESQTIGRFGNWVEVGTANGKFLLFHFQTILASLGTFVSTGELLGTAGSTGFDTRSGRVISEHIHLEYTPTNTYVYSNDDSVNPLDRLLLPRTDVTDNVSVVRSRANDPDGVDSWRLAITVSRADSDFDLNTITLAGDLATRTVNWDTRAGLNADNDIPKHDGVYIVPGAFDSTSVSYTVSVYFNTGTVGTTFASYEVRDTQGTLLASE